MLECELETLPNHLHLDPPIEIEALANGAGGGEESVGLGEVEVRHRLSLRPQPGDIEIEGAWWPIER